MRKAQFIPKILPTNTVSCFPMLPRPRHRTRHLPLPVGPLVWDYTIISHASMLQPSNKSGIQQ